MTTFEITIGVCFVVSAVTNVVYSFVIRNLAERLIDADDRALELLRKNNVTDDD